MATDYMSIILSAVKKYNDSEVQKFSIYSKDMSPEDAARRFLEESLIEMFQKVEFVKYNRVILTNGLTPEEAFDYVNSVYSRMPVVQVKEDYKNLCTLCLSDMFEPTEEDGKGPYIGRFGIKTNVDDKSIIKLKFASELVGDKQNKSCVNWFLKGFKEELGPAYMDPSVGTLDDRITQQLLANQELMLANQGEIKADTEQILVYTSQIETILNEVEDMDNFLKKNLGSDFTKISSAYKQMKEGKIKKKEFIGRSLKVLAPKLLKIIV